MIIKAGMMRPIPAIPIKATNVKMVERGEGTLKTLKGKTRTLNGHNRSMWYDGKLYLM